MCSCGDPSCADTPSKTSTRVGPGQCLTVAAHTDNMAVKSTHKIHTHTQLLRRLLGQLQKGHPERVVGLQACGSCTDTVCAWHAAPACLWSGVTVTGKEEPGPEEMPLRHFCCKHTASWEPAHKSSLINPQTQPVPNQPSACCVGAPCQACNGWHKRCQGNVRTLPRQERHSQTARDVPLPLYCQAQDTTGHKCYRHTRNTSTLNNSQIVPFWGVKHGRRKV